MRVSGRWASLSACHMLWYFHLASSAKIVVHSYTDDPLGRGEVHPDGSGQFRSATLRPSIVVANGTDLERATTIHHDVHRYCFIARSVNFPITYAPNVSAAFLAAVRSKNAMCTARAGAGGSGRSGDPDPCRAHPVGWLPTARGPQPPDNRSGRARLADQGHGTHHRRVAPDRPYLRNHGRDAIQRPRAA